MSLQYSGGTLVNTTFTQSGATRGEIVSNLISALLSAGWTNLSGTGTDQVLQCAATMIGVTGLRIAVRIYDPGSGSCARVALRNISGSRIGQDLYLFPALGKVWRIIANQYQFFIMTPGSSATREFVYAGQLIVPTWLSATATNCGLAQGNAISDTDVAARASYRNSLNSANLPVGSSFARETHLVSDVLLDMSNLTYTGTGVLAGSCIQSANCGRTFGNAYRWADNTLVDNDPLVAFGLSSASDEAKFQGQMSDAVVVDDAFTADMNISLDGHTWWGITNNNNGVAGTTDYGNIPRGTLFIRVA